MAETFEQLCAMSFADALEATKSADLKNERLPFSRWAIIFWALKNVILRQKARK